jgi:hypothetical protein
MPENKDTRCFTDSPDVRDAAQALIDLFVWEPGETGDEPHIDRAFPEFNDVLTALRNALSRDCGERCPTCNMTDAGYSVYIKGWCRDPWHGDDHLRRSRSIPSTEGK